MTSPVNPIPEGFHTATPYLIVKDLPGAMEFYKTAFGATELMFHSDPSGKFKNAEMKIGSSMIMIGEHQNMGAHDPQALPPVSIYLYVEDANALARQAIATGARELYPVEDHFYGNREGGVEDPFGIVWWIATRIEEVAPEEMQKRAAAAFSAS